MMSLVFTSTNVRTD